mgnify:CR=1 FL=1
MTQRLVRARLLALTETRRHGERFIDWISQIAQRHACPRRSNGPDNLHRTFASSHGTEATRIVLTVAFFSVPLCLREIFSLRANDKVHTAGGFHFDLETGAAARWHATTCSRSALGSHGDTETRRELHRLEQPNRIQTRLPSTIEQARKPPLDFRLLARNVDDMTVAFFSVSLCLREIISWRSLIFF